MVDVLDACCDIGAALGLHHLPRRDPREPDAGPLHRSDVSVPLCVPSPPCQRAQRWLHTVCLADGAGGGGASVNTVNLTPFRVIGIRFALMQTAEGLWEYAVSQGNA